MLVKTSSLWVLESMYLGVGVFLGLLCKNVTYGWCSENVFISIPDVGLQFDDINGIHKRLRLVSDSIPIIIVGL